MNTELIYKTAKDLKLNINLFNELKKDLNERILNEFNSLVKLGDSEELALATVLETSLTDEEYKEKYNFYNNVYTK